MGIEIIRIFCFECFNIEIVGYQVDALERAVW